MHPSYEICRYGCHSGIRLPYLFFDVGIRLSYLHQKLTPVPPSENNPYEGCSVLLYASACSYRHLYICHIHIYTYVIL